MGRLRFVCILVIFIFALAALPAVAQDSLSPGDSASGTATVSRPVSYLLNVNPGDIITVRAQTDGFLRQRVYGANDEQVRRPDFKSSRETSIYVFEMDEPGPYRLELSGDAAFSLTIESGDTLTLDRGVIKPGQSANATATLDRLDIYTLEVAAPLTLTLDLQNAPGAPVSGSARLTGITGSAQQAEVTTVARHLNVYTLEEAGTFRLVVNVEQGDYTLSIVEGDTVTNNLGALQPGQTISGTIVPDRVNFYDIQASPEARITVTFQGITDSRNAPRVDLVGEGFDRNDIETEEEDKGITVYVLDEDPPYRLAVAGEGSYTLSWSGGDTLTSAGGALVAGQPVMAGLVAGQPAVFTLEGLAEGAAGSLLAGLDFTSVENPQPIITAMTLTNGSGEILPLTEIVSTGELPLFADYATWVFELAGPAPYTLTVEGERAAPLLLNPTLKPGETAQLMAEPYSETGLTLALDAAESLVGLQLDGEDVPNLYDATGENLWSGAQERDVNGQRVVTYRLSGRPPYVMNLYNLSDDLLQMPVTLLDGAALIAAAPTVTPGDGVTVTSSLSGASLVFNLDAPEGTRVGYLIDLPPDLRERLQFSLLTIVYNGSGEVMSNIRDGAPDRVQAYGLQLEVYTLTGPAPYTLEIRRSGDDLPPFDLTLYTVNADSDTPGAAFIALGATVSGRPVGRSSAYRFDVPGAQTVTVRVEGADAAPESLTVYVAGDRNAFQNPQTFAQDGRALTATFALQPGSYVVEFPASGDFTLSLTGQ